MVGYAVTCVIEPSNSKYAAVQPHLGLPIATT